MALTFLLAFTIMMLPDLYQFTVGSPEYFQAIADSMRSQPVATPTGVVDAEPRTPPAAPPVAAVRQQPRATTSAAVAAEPSRSSLHPAATAAIGSRRRQALARLTDTPNDPGERALTLPNCSDG